MPPLANGAKAAVSSNGVTSEVPSASEGIGSSLEAMPSRCAVAATFLGPTSSASRTATVFSECASAVESVTGP